MDWGLGETRTSQKGGGVELPSQIWGACGDPRIKKTVNPFLPGQTQAFPFYYWNRNYALKKKKSAPIRSK